MDATGAIIREIQAAQEQARKLLQIRVTPDAIPGAPVSAPIAPERADDLLEEWEDKYDAYLESEERIKERVPEPPETVEGMSELLVHPGDWQELRHDHPDLLDGEIYAFNGLFVDTREAEG